jgi:hypothetical protein
MLVTQALKIESPCRINFQNSTALDAVSETSFESILRGTALGKMKRKEQALRRDKCLPIYSYL